MVPQLFGTESGVNPFSGRAKPIPSCVVKTRHVKFVKSEVRISLFRKSHILNLIHIQTARELCSS